jgi:cytosine/adenosine deaminase-related metal-dependent hydrolase
MRYRARWVLPIAAPPIENGFVEVANGRVVAVGPRAAAIGPATDLGDAALMPGLVNAHTHLELSWMAGLLPPKDSMDEWIRGLMTLRRSGPSGGPDDVAKAALAAMVRMRESGTMLVGDISNTLITPGLLAASGLRGVVFHELIGFAGTDPDRVVREAEARIAEHRALPLELSVVAHAPYSVSPDLITAIARAPRTAPLAIHLGESVEEIEFLATGQGPIRRMLEQLGVWDGTWPVPGCGPVEYIARLGYLQAGTLVVHGVHLSMSALVALKQAGAVLVSCPRSNLWVGTGSPPLARSYESGVPVVFGTDSLASVDTLSMFDELAEARRVARGVPAASLLDSATRQGARALGLGALFGSIEAGRRAALIAVALPDGDRRFGATDVEEYLVGGDVDAAADVRLVRAD